jgi:hypothetical protein
MRRKTGSAAASTAQRQNRLPAADHPAQPGRRRRSEGNRPPERRAGAPWHFWLVVVMATVYLGWRAVEGIVWLVQWFAGVVG